MSSESEGPIAGARVGLGAAESDRLELSEADVAAVVRAEIAERLEAAEVYENSGQPDRAQALRDEIAVLLGHVGES